MPEETVESAAGDTPAAAAMPAMRAARPGRPSGVELSGPSDAASRAEPLARDAAVGDSSSAATTPVTDGTWGTDRTMSSSCAVGISSISCAERASGSSAESTAVSTRLSAAARSRRDVTVATAVVSPGAASADAAEPTEADRNAAAAAV